MVERRRRFEHDRRARTGDEQDEREPPHDASLTTRSRRLVFGSGRRTSAARNEPDGGLLLAKLIERYVCDSTGSAGRPLRSLRYLSRVWFVRCTYVVRTKSRTGYYADTRFERSTDAIASDRWGHRPEKWFGRCTYGVRTKSRTGH
jgi:hypothetical protein